MTHRSEEGRARAEAMFRGRENRHTTESDRVWARRGAAAGRAADVNRAKLKEQRLARDAAEKPSTPKGAENKSRPPAPRERRSAHKVRWMKGQKRRTRPQGSAK